MTMLTFLQVNDLHGYVAPHPEMVRDEHGHWQFAELGGLARIAGLFDAVRAERPDAVIALDNGDTFHGTHLAVTSKGQTALGDLIRETSLQCGTRPFQHLHSPRLRRPAPRFATA